MKHTIVATFLALSFTAGVHAASPHDHMNHGAAAKAPADATLTEGVVKKIDKTAGKITLAHGQLPNGMPGMTMSFKIKEASWLAGIREGQRVMFAIDDAMTIVRLETAK